jgi:hypothetical protein
MLTVTSNNAHVEVCNFTPPANNMGAVLPIRVDAGSPVEIEYQIAQEAFCPLSTHLLACNLERRLRPSRLHRRHRLLRLNPLRRARHPVVRRRLHIRSPMQRASSS